jgi:hypothetical protein
MNFRCVALALMIFGILAASVRSASSQAYERFETVPPGTLDCSIWSTVPEDKEGTRRRVFSYWIGHPDDPLNPGRERRGTGLVPVGKDGGYDERVGTFVTKIPMPVGILSRPNDFENPDATFILPRWATIDFYPDPPSTTPFPLRSGKFHAFNTRPIVRTDPKRYSVDCVRGKSDVSLERAIIKLGWPSVSDKSASSADSTPDWMARWGAATAEEPRPPGSIHAGSGSIRAPFDKDSKAPSAAPAGSGIEDMFSSKPEPRLGIDTSPTARAKTGAIPVPGPPLNITPEVKGAEVSKEAMASGIRDAMAPAIKEAAAPNIRDVLAPVIKDAPRPPGPICDASTGHPLPMPKDLKLASLQTVGRRNDSALAEGYEYLVSGDAFSIGKMIDVADSRRKLVPYETVAVSRAAAPEKLWVSIPGVDESRGKRPEPAAAKPVRTLRIIVFSGAAELAISGLDLVDAPFKSTGSDLIGLDIEWQIIDQTGLIKPAGQYSSFSALVRAATDKGVDRPDVLNEAGLSILFDEFENLLKTRTIDKAFWIKGAYALPSSIPQRFERFLATVSSSNAIPRSPSGQPGKWLQVLTARTPGFSIAYLKEPVNLLQIGDVVEEGDGAGGGPRRLITITDANVLASRLRTGLTSSPVKPPSTPPPDRGGLAGKLVLDANEVFDERGYVLSADAALALQAHLQQVLKLWDAAGVVSTEALDEFTRKIYKSRPTMIDVLQMADAKAYMRLPRTVLDWSRKPLKDLNQTETDEAKAFVTTYVAAVGRLVDRTKSPGTNCNLYYVSEEYLGFR